ncbi:SDR family oxidoreductase [soil metagenome]
MALSIDLSGKVVLVTGASRGIGKATAEAFGDAGARVAVHYASNENAARGVSARCGNAADVFQTDLSNPTSAQNLWDEVLSRFGQIDVLVNNAGIAEAAPPETDLPDWLNVWERTMAINATAPAVLCRAACEHFAERHAGGDTPIAGRIVNVASRAAFRGDTPEYLAYAASKGALVAMTRSIARGYGRKGTAAFVVAPGFTQTDMARPFMERYGADYATSDLALPTLTQPEDIAPTIVFLASGLADHATGATIDLNAGSYVH